uniref:Maltoporin n=1 Tax=Heterorhabditis bacteriophora TaxID=37862 RepID=A0A1I7WP22_HETBA
MFNSRRVVGGFDVYAFHLRMSGNYLQVDGVGNDATDPYNGSPRLLACHHSQHLKS